MTITRVGPTGNMGPTVSISTREHLRRIYKDTDILLGSIKIDKDELFDFMCSYPKFPYYHHPIDITDLFDDPRIPNM